MKNFKNFFVLSSVIITLVLASAAGAYAQRRNDRDIRDAVRSLSSKIEDFEMDLRYQMQSNSANNSEVGDLSDRVRVLKSGVQQFQDNYDRRRENREDVTRIVDSARRIDDFMKTYPQNNRAQENWNGVRRQIDRIGSNYGMTINWNNQEEEPQKVKDYPDPVPTKNVYSIGLSGTYTLDPAASESVDDAVSDSRLGAPQREELKDKLTAPEQIAIDLRGGQVTLATSNASPVTFSADGREKTEQGPDGKTIRLRATLNGQVLTVASLGGDTDYTITFTSVNNGQSMKVMRRITTPYTSQTVFAESVYNKTDATAGLGINIGGTAGDQNGGYSDNDNQTGNGGVTNGGSSPPANGRRGPVAGTPRPGNYVVPNGTVITGVLENEINTAVSQNNDRFRMTVQSPDEFRGATVEGYISNVQRSGKVTGESNVTFNFERITLRNGQSYDFAGNLQSITDHTGKVVNTDNEGTARGGSQTKQTVKRGGIGAGLGAIIGAIAGGAKGAAIGAVIGGGAGAGSVVIQGKNDIQLRQGSTITVQSSSTIQKDR